MRWAPQPHHVWPAMMASFTVRGSYGSLTVDPVTGAVLRYDPYDDGAEHSPNDPPGTAYADIVRIDLVEWQQVYPNESPAGAECDILDVGFWTALGTYVPPEEDYRNEVAAWRAGR